MHIEITEGDLLDQDVDSIVNAWNRNLIPWWLLLPKGVSGAIKKRAGYAPFLELGKRGVLPLGGATVTTAGKLPFKGIIHVAGIGHTWISSEKAIRSSVRSALQEAAQHYFHSVGFPLIGAGTGGISKTRAEEIMLEEIKASQYKERCVIVRYPAKKGKD